MTEEEILQGLNTKLQVTKKNTSTGIRLQDIISLAKYAAINRSGNSITMGDFIIALLFVEATDETAKSIFNAIPLPESIPPQINGKKYVDIANKEPELLIDTDFEEMYLNFKKFLGSTVIAKFRTNGVDNYFQSITQTTQGDDMTEDSNSKLQLHQMMFDNVKEKFKFDRNDPEYIEELTNLVRMCKGEGFHEQAKTIQKEIDFVKDALMQMLPSGVKLTVSLEEIFELANRASYKVEKKHVASLGTLSGVFDNFYLTQEILEHFESIGMPYSYNVAPMNLRTLPSVPPPTKEEMLNSNFAEISKTTNLKKALTQKFGKETKIAYYYHDNKHKLHNWKDEIPTLEKMLHSKSHTEHKKAKQNQQKTSPSKMKIAYEKTKASEVENDKRINFNNLNSSSVTILKLHLDLYSLWLQLYQKASTEIDTDNDIKRVTNKINAIKKALGEDEPSVSQTQELHEPIAEQSEGSVTESWFGWPAIFTGLVFTLLYFFLNSGIIGSLVIAVITYFTTQTWKRFLIFGLLTPLIIGSITIYIKNPKAIENFFKQNEKKEQTNSSDRKRPSLNISTNVSNPNIKILNIKEKFHQGIQLKPGTYTVEVKKRGYIAKRRKIQIKDENVFTGIYLEKQTTGKKKQISRYPLYIKTLKGARIQVLNIKQKYYSGIRLKPGKYRIRVSKSGYITREKTIYISNSSQYIKIPLKKQTSSLRKRVSTKSDQTRKGSIQVPDNATLNKDGKSWSCKTGYMKIRDHCKRVI